MKSSIGRLYQVRPCHSRTASTGNRKFPTGRRDERRSSPTANDMTMAYPAQDAAMIRISLSAFAAIVTLTFSSPPARAEGQAIFKCIDAEGSIAFQAIPCLRGAREQRITLAPAPPPSASPDYVRTTPARTRDERVAQSAQREKPVQSYECRTRSGMLFYRHDRCPSSVARGSTDGGKHGGVREPVRAQRIPRLEACRGMRSVARDGREFDDDVSTYDRNLGRDPCRRY